MDEYGAKISFRGLTFRRKDFRANDQHSLSRGARRLLQQEPRTRTERDINLLLVALRHIPAFAEYPRKMQWRLCQVGRFEAYEPRRVVLKEGDVPTSFYFILSGTVIVTAFEEATQTSRTLVSLTKGMSFGEFKEIFMAGGRDILASEKQREFIKAAAKPLHQSRFWLVLFSSAHEVYTSGFYGCFAAKSASDRQPCDYLGGSTPCDVGH
ncbi:hypothetical protein EGW08_019534 [Elysia chlorotica]|uniref:Cyclic nucleotide-binding domain-containing protein n=1 Tax=Elysia chlorotica TaxID=188477 RepID=A0A3S0Z9P7_ELYCH|nr:hypothetical protein EGW08_019534 [Elysia chlorotica]